MEEAIKWVLGRKLNRIGFRKATFKDIPAIIPMEDGWMDLSEKDDNARLENDQLILDLWFPENVVLNPPAQAIISSKTVTAPLYKDQVLNKFRMIIELDYIYLDGKRAYIEIEEDKEV